MLKLTAIAIIAFDANAWQQTCHALALSGGGTNGAFEAGVIWGLMHYGNP